MRNLHIEPLGSEKNNNSKNLNLYDSDSSFVLRRVQDKSAYRQYKQLAFLISSIVFLIIVSSKSYE